MQDALSETSLEVSIQTSIKYLERCRPKKTATKELRSRQIRIIVATQGVLMLFDNAVLVEKVEDDRHSFMAGDLTRC